MRFPSRMILKGATEIKLSIRSILIHIHISWVTLKGSLVAHFTTEGVPVALFYWHLYGGGGERVLIAWNLLHQHLNKKESFQKYSNSSHMCVKPLHLQETHHHQRGALPRETNGQAVKLCATSEWANSGDLTAGGTGKPCTANCVGASFSSTPTAAAAQHWIAWIISTRAVQK